MKKKLGLICLSIITIATLTCNAQQEGNASAAEPNAKVYPGMIHSFPDMDNVVHMKDSVSGQDIWLFGGNTLNTKSLFFIESEIKPGFPEGWITNSKVPILQKSESGKKYLDLYGQDNVFVGQLIEVTGQKSLILTLGYLSECEASLEYMQFDEYNKLCADNQAIVLSSGDFQTIEIILDLSKSAERLMFKINKDFKGQFYLKTINIERAM